MLNKMRKVDFYVGQKEFSERVVEFMRCKVWKKAIQLEFQAKIDAANDIIDKIGNLDGSILAEHAEATRIAGLAQIAEYQKQRDEQIAKEAKFEFSEADKKFKKALKEADGSADLISDAVVAFFATYGLNVDGTYFLAEVLDTFGMKFDFKTLVATGGRDARAIDVNRALEMMYATAYTHMATVHVIKMTQIPEIVREKFAPKKSNKKSKKENK